MFGKKRILIVEDDKMQVKLLTQFLKQIGHKVYSADNFNTAFDLFNKKRMDLVICDILLPGISGISFVSAIKNGSSGNVPVIVISSSAKGDSMVESLPFKGVEFMPKPIYAGKLYERVEQLTY